MQIQQRNIINTAFLSPLKYFRNTQSNPVYRISILVFTLFIFSLATGCSTQRTIAIPAHGISYPHTSTNFSIVRRGLNWGNANDYGSITIPKPADYKDGPITMRIFFQVISDESGTIKFIATPVAFNSGNSMETYGAIAATAIPAPGDLTSLYEQEIQITSGNGWSEQPDWWYIEINRGGTFPGTVRVMGVAIDYKSVQ